MIIISDVPFFDAFSYAKSLSNDNISYWSPGEPLPAIHHDIFSEDVQSDVCFASNINTQTDFENVDNISKIFKAVIVWNSNYESFKKYCTLNSLEHKLVQVPKYIDLKNSITQSSALGKNMLKKVLEEIDQTPIASRLNRDTVSNIVHKISVIYSGDNVSCSIGDVAMGSPVSLLDITNAFCKGEDDFYNFCYYHFGQHKLIEPSMKSWIFMVNKFLISHGNVMHDIYKLGGSNSPKLSEMINSKLSGLIKQEDILFVSLCWSYIMRVEEFEQAVVFINAVRSAVSGKLNKKHSINMIRNFNE